MPQTSSELPDFFSRRRALPGRVGGAAVEVAERGGLVDEDAAGEVLREMHTRVQGATPSDPAFVTGRFATLQSRRPAPAEETPDA